jgi:hypothetical protein
MKKCGVHIVKLNIFWTVGECKEEVSKKEAGDTTAVGERSVRAGRVHRFRGGLEEVQP